MEVTTDVDAPAERVWEVITDLDGSPDRISAIESVERLDGGGPLVLGTRWRETRRMFGASATEEMEVAAIDPPRSYEVVSHSRGAVYRSVLSVAPRTDRTSRLTMAFDATPTGRVAAIASRLMSPLVSGSMRKALSQDLDDIRRAAEAGSSDAGRPG